MKNKKSNSMLGGAFVLMVAIVLVKIIGALFKMPMTSLIGITGRGYFNSAYEIYTPIFAIAMAGLPVAVSKMVAESVACGQYRQARSVFEVSKKIFIIVGIAGTVLLLAFAYPYAKFVANIKSLKAILCVAPSIYICCYMSAYRGYYEGLRNMVPTAISQVIEALGKLVIGLGLIKLIMSVGSSQYEQTMAASGKTSAVVFGETVYSLTEANSVIVPWAAAGAVLGVTIGSALSLAFLIIFHKIKGDEFTPAQLSQSDKPRQGIDTAKYMIRIAIPMVVSALILNITNLIDATTIQARLTGALNSNFEDVVSMYSSSIDKAVSLARLNISDKGEVMKYIWGAYGTALDFKSLVPTITIQLGVSAIPALAAAWAQKNKERMKELTETVLRIAMLIALPAGLGIACLAEAILTIIYGRGNSNEAIPIIAPILIVYGICTPLFAVSTPVTNMLQAVGRADLPMKTVAAAAVCKIACNFILVGIPKINVYGAVAGTVLFYAIIVGVNLYNLIKISKIKVDWKAIFLKPLICAAMCGITAYATHGIITAVFPQDTSLSIINSNTIGTLAAVLLGAIVYIIALLLFKAVAKSDLETLPFGEKIVNILDKKGLLA